MDLTSNYFEIFGLPSSFDINLQSLSDQYRELQKKFHPDRYASQSSAQQRLAVQYTAFINQAFSTLQSPVARAQYLLEQQGVDCSHNALKVQDSAFLMEQMSLRETLGEVSEAADPFAELENLRASVAEAYDNLQHVFSGQYNAEDWACATETVAKMQFYQKLLSEIEQLEEALDS